MTFELFGLLTRIRLTRGNLDLGKAAREQYLFPLIGMLAGLLAALGSIVLATYLGDGLTLISGGIVVVLLFYVTGILHLEGLADFSDGVMTSGTVERKREAMKDVHLGVAGVFSVVLYLLVLFALAAEVCSRANEDVQAPAVGWWAPFAIGFVLSEAAGKVAMNTSMYMGPSSHPGMGSLFVGAATLRKLLASLVIAGVAGFVFAGLLFPIVYLGVAAGGAVTHLARKNLGGVSGDSFGAANEVGRIVTLLAWVLVA